MLLKCFFTSFSGFEGLVRICQKVRIMRRKRSTCQNENVRENIQTRFLTVPKSPHGIAFYCLFTTERGRIVMQKAVFHIIKCRLCTSSLRLSSGVKTVFIMQKSRFRPSFKLFSLHIGFTSRHNVLHVSRLRLHTFPYVISVKLFSVSD